MISARIFLKEPIIVLDLLNISMVLIGIVLIVKPPFIFGDLEVYITVMYLWTRPFFFGGGAEGGQQYKIQSYDYE